MADSTGSGDPGATMRARTARGRAREWVLLTANRWAVAGALLATLFATFVLLGAFDPVGLRSAVESSDPVETLFQALVPGIVTGVTLVVTINQLVLSQELGPVGDQRERMEGAMGFRRDVEDYLGSPVGPPEPASFLRAVVEASRSRAESLADAADGSRDDEFREAVDELVDDVVRNAEAVVGRLDDAEFGTFEVVHAALDYDYSWKIYRARRLDEEYGDAPDGVAEALDDLVEVLEFFGVAREHFKTLYFQWELIDLSRAVLYAAVPALAVAVSMILYADDPGSVAGTTLGVDNLVWLVSAATTLALLPFALLLAYILRIATVAKRTLAIGPFVLRETGDGDRE